MRSLMKRLAGVVTGIGLLFASMSAGDTAPLIFTDKASFDAAIAGWPSQTLNFESFESGQMFHSGSNVAGITFTYTIGGEVLKATSAFATPASDPDPGNPWV